MKVAIVSMGFETQRLRLQPHRTLLEMGRQLTTLGHDVVLISDGRPQLPSQDRLLGLPVRRLTSVRSFRGGANSSLLASISRESPDLLLWHLGLSSLVHQGLRLPFPVPAVGVITSPIHSPLQILRLGPLKLVSDLRLVTVLLLASVVPKAPIRHAFSEGGLNGAITLSETTRRYVIRQGVPARRVWAVPPGADQDWLDWKASEEEGRKVRHSLGFATRDFVLVYFGSPSPLRGLNTTLKAVEQVAQAYPHFRLLVLSRRTTDERGKHANHLHGLIKRKGLQGRVCVIEGFLEKHELIRYVDMADAVCLPFEIVPSDMPLSIIEAMALEHGVITTNVACIPELVGDERGFLVHPGSVRGLARQLRQVVEAPEITHARGIRARDFIERRMTWQRMGTVLEEALMIAQSA